eukprot:CAMPEP_0113573156 /NCGR_PEP_ID=MMETSP0015_2-20120614/26466_1 /TAXON_ID=2838 /ORGANISM="Odontella" /LENGTH=66 /DNA_ID=CAMNT_0000476213 /DNA_START=174 /DNA_END=374 /DNA_ORIENTATION=- /assembly_acc=CAM_ASM_000160
MPGSSAPLTNLASVTILPDEAADSTGEAGAASESGDDGALTWACLRCLLRFLPILIGLRSAAGFDL